MAGTDQRSSKQAHVYMETGFITTGITCQQGKDELYNKWRLDSFSYRKMKSDPYLVPYTEINSTWIKDLSAHGTMKTFLEDNRGESPTNSAQRIIS